MKRTCLLLVLGGCLLHAQESKENSDFKLAVNLYNDAMYDLAAEQLKNFISAYPNTSNGIEARYYLGLTQMKLKRYEDARMTFQNFALAYVDHPKAPEALMNVAEAFLSLKNEREAASAYERVKTFYPKSPLVPSALLQAAQLYRKLSDRENATKIFRAIEQDYPTDQHAPAGRLALAEMYYEEGQTELAAQEARHLSETEAPADIKANALCLLGTLKESASLFDEAEKVFRSISVQYKATTGAAKAAYALAGLLAGREKFGDAIDCLRETLAYTREDTLKSKALFELADVFAEKRTFDSAIVYYRKVLNEFPGSSLHDVALYKAGLAAYHRKDYDHAAEFFTSILSLPSSALQRDALILLAEVAKADHRLDEAAGFYQSFIERYPLDVSAAEIGFKLGLLYENQIHDYRKAITAFCYVAEKFPRSPYAADGLIETGRSCEELGNYEEAIQAYTDLLIHYPCHPRTEEIEHLIAFLQNHKVRNRDVGMEKLARLVGEMLIEKSKANLALQLGRVYMDELKDYVSAIQQFTFAIDQGLDEKNFVDAYYLRARAYHLRAEPDSAVTDQAITYYDAFRKQYPADSLNYDAAFYSFQLKSERQSANETLLLGKDLLSLPLRPRFRADVLSTLYSLSLKSSNIADANVFISQLENETAYSRLLQRGLVAIGAWYDEHNHPDTAIIFWKNASTLSGYYTAAALEHLADAQTQARAYADAVMNYKRLVSEFPYLHDATRAKRKLADAYLADARYDDAIQEYEACRVKSSDSPVTTNQASDIDLQLAKSYEKKGNTQQVMIFYNRYLRYHQRDSSAGQAYYSLGVIARNEGRSDEATEYFKQAAALGSAGAASQEIADLLFQNEEYGEAAKQYEKLAAAAASTADKEKFQGKVVVATLRMDRLADAQKLIASFEKTYRDAKEYRAEFEYEKAMLHYRKQDLTKASKAFEDVSNDYEDTRVGPWAHYYLGKILEISNKFPEAAKKYENILNKFPSADVIPHVLLSLGNMHFNAERYDEAIGLYQKILELGDQASDILPYAMNNLIEAYESTKLYDAALKLTREFINRYPYDESTIDKKIKIGTLYTRLGYYDQAVLHFQNLLNESGSLLEAELHYDIGEAYYYKGDYRQAILDFLKVPYLVSRQGKVNWTATALYMAGQSYEKLSKFDEAVGMYQQIVDRSGIDATFKAAAKKEIERVRSVIQKEPK